MTEPNCGCSEYPECTHMLYWHQGANWMLDNIRASLREYPNVGGDTEVMAQVERIAGAAFSARVVKLQQEMLRRSPAHMGNDVLESDDYDYMLGRRDAFGEVADLLGDLLESAIGTPTTPKEPK